MCASDGTQLPVIPIARLIDGLELKPRNAFGPLRTGISGRRIIPPLFESMELLGKDSTLTRLGRLAAALR
jgi:glutamyl-tRNA synthetase